MKKLSISILFAVIISNSFGQFAWTYKYDTLNINNWSTLISATNSNFWDMYSGNQGAFIPKTDATSPLYSQNIWMGGFDSNNQLYVSANRYYQNGIALGPGPYANNYDSVFYAKYNRLWKVNKTEITYHCSHFNQSGYVMPEAIENWPGNGNPSNGEMNILAPFVDYNLNGIYDPQNGDYPYIRGDQAIYFILNDKADTSTSLNVNQVGVEVHVMVYAFQGTGVINNTFFMHFDVINRSQNSYHNFKFAVNTDVDLGNASDDYIGCDTTQNMYFGYNGDSNDDGETWSYGTYPPAIGIKFLSKKMTNFMYFINGGASGMSDPLLGSEYYNSMNSIWKDSTKLVHNGSGYDPNNQADSCNFAYPEYSNWTMFLNSINPHDIRGVGAVNIGDFNTNSCFTSDIAYIWARDLTNPSNHASVELLLSQAPDVQAFYNQLHADTNCSYLSGIHSPKIAHHFFKIYPNPANENLNIVTNLNNFKIKIFTVVGKVVLQSENTKTLDISKIKSGVYFIDITDGKKIDRRKFIISR